VTSYLDAGVEYYLLVWKYGDEPPLPGHTAVQVEIDLLPQTTPPSNDDCAAAEIIPPGGPFPYTTAIVADVSSASCADDPSPPSCQSNTSRSVWYRLSPDRSGLFRFSTCSEAPTGTSVDDTVISVYQAAASCVGPFVEVGCDDDSCGQESHQAVTEDLRLDAGEDYYVVVWEFGTEPPSSENTAVQLRIDADFTPLNDLCEGAFPLALDSPVDGTTVSANDSYRLDDSGCFVGVGQDPTTAPGPDTTYLFTAPESGEYSFRISGYNVGLPYDATLYVSSTCEGGALPVNVTSCLSASNRNAGGPSEEVSCLALTSGQTVYVTVDNADTLTGGSNFTLEVNRCTRESEPNDDTNSPNAPGCGMEGSISPPGDVDFYGLGQPEADSRIFALVDGVAANPSNSNFDLRVTTETQTLEYDDANNDAEFGNLSPNVAGTKALGEATFLQVTQKSSSAEAEPYRLYSVVQGPDAVATPETEPNDSPVSADFADYLYGSLPGPAPSTDVDVYGIQAIRGDLWVISLDGDPGYDHTPLNAKLEILDGDGSVLLTVNDNGATGTERSPVAGLTATSPTAPAEGLAFRVPASGSYFVRVSAGSGGANTSGDYLLSIAPGCLGADADDDGVPNVTDCARETPGGSPPDRVLGLSVDRDSSGDLSVAWNPVAGGDSYDVARGDLSALRSSGYPGGAVCAASELPSTPYVEPGSSCPIGPGEACWYLVRGVSTCGPGTFGSMGLPGDHPLDGASSPCP